MFHEKQLPVSLNVAPTGRSRTGLHVQRRPRSGVKLYSKSSSPGLRSTTQNLATFIEGFRGGRRTEHEVSQGDNFSYRISVITGEAATIIVDLLPTMSTLLIFSNDASDLRSRRFKITWLSCRSFRPYVYCTISGLHRLHDDLQGRTREIDALGV